MVRVQVVATATETRDARNSHGTRLVDAVMNVESIRCISVDHFTLILSSGVYVLIKHGRA